MTPEHTRRTDFSRLVAERVTLVDFTAQWCQPCRDQEHIVRALEKAFQKSVRIEILNVDEYREMALKLGIQSIPTIIICRDGKELKRFIGLQPSEILDHALRAAIA